jgi:chitinase
MVHIAHSDWMFEHSLGDHPNTLVDPHSATSTGDLAHQPTPAGSAVSALNALWHHSDNPGSGSPAPTKVSDSSSTANSSTGSGKEVPPTLTIANNALTVNAGGSISLPISVSPANGQTSVTIAGLANYETVTDTLDGKMFAPDAHGSITLSAAEVNSGLSLASNPTPDLAAQHPVNTLTVTAAEAVGPHTLTSTSQTITVTDPPPSTSSGGETLTLQVSGDQYNGDPQIAVLVDGQQVGTYAVTADHASGQTQTITITGNFDPSVAHQVQVEFTNDSWDGTSWWSNGSGADGHDRNVYVEAISLNGQTINGSQGTDAATNGSVSASNPNEAVMDVNGTLTFNVPDPPATTSTSGSGTSSSASSTGSGGLAANIAGEYLLQDGASNDTTLAAAVSSTHGLNYFSWFEACGLNDGSGHIQLAGTYSGMATDIANYEATGGHVTLTIGGDNSDPGGANALVLNNSTELMNMYNDIKALSSKYGFQGIDWDLENNTNGVQYTVSEAAQLFQMLKTPTPGTPFGPNFSITLDPAPYEIRSPDGLMAQLYAAAANNIDLVAPQFYTQANQSDSWFLNQYIMPTLNGMTTLASQSSGLVDIPASKIVLLCADNNGNEGSPGGAAAYFNDYNVAKTTYPTLRGLLWFHTASDQGSNWGFGENAAAVVGA